MTKGNQFKRALALSTALSVVALGATTTAADASLDPGKSQGKSQSTDKGKSQDKGKDKGKSQDKQSAPSKGNADNGKSDNGNSGKSNDNGSSQGGSNAGQGPKGKGGQDKSPQDKGPQDKSPQDKSPQDKGDKDKGDKGGDPAGNNGTVKITPHGEVDGIPQNTPHVGCIFDVEWYGFDEGDDIYSIVTFEAWAPTRGDIEVVQGIVGEPGIFVGADPASGAGVGSDEDGTDADNGFDGQETYELAFPGIEPHPKQGYHVKLTINTPGSQGADTKHKVFWVQECEETPEVETPEVETPEVETPEVETPEVETPEVETPEVETPEVEGEEGNEENDNDSDIEVLGEQGNDAQVNGAQGGETLPTAVDAGLQAAKWVASPTPTPLYVALFGAILAGLGLLVRRRFN